MEPPAEAGSKDYIIYDISLENGGVGPQDTFAVRIYNPYGDAVVWGYLNGEWTQLESKERGQYLQIEMLGDKEAFCVIKHTSYKWVIIGVCAAAAVVLIILAVLIKGIHSRRLRKKAEN